MARFGTGLDPLGVVSVRDVGGTLVREAPGAEVAKSLIVRRGRR